MSGACAADGRGSGLVTGEGPRARDEGPGGQVEGLSFDVLVGPEAPLLAPEQGIEGCDRTMLYCSPSCFRNLRGGRFRSLRLRVAGRSR